MRRFWRRWRRRRPTWIPARTPSRGEVMGGLVDHVRRREALPEPWRSQLRVAASERGRAEADATRAWEAHARVKRQLDDTVRELGAVRAERDRAVQQRDYYVEVVASVAATLENQRVTIGNLRDMIESLRWRA